MIRATIREQGREVPWVEEYSDGGGCSLHQARQFVKEIIDKWNLNLQPGHQPRVLIKVELIKAGR